MNRDGTLFDKFGGIRPMARACKKSASTVGRWAVLGRIPANEQPNILETAERLGLPVSAEDVVYPLGRPQLALPLVDAPVAGDESRVACDRPEDLQKGDKQ